MTDNEQPVSTEDFLDQTLESLRDIYSGMDSKAGRVVFQSVGPFGQFRHVEKTESLVCYLKGAKAVSTLSACVVLLRQGYVQEINALCRMVDDFCNEIVFLLAPQGEDDDWSAAQISFLESFFKEELDEPEDPLRSEQKRNTVPTKKIRAAFARMAADDLNPSDSAELMRTVQQALSGYVHGAYPHIMELYGGSPPGLHLRGMANTPRIEEGKSQLIDFVYKVIIASVFVARKLDSPEHEATLRGVLNEFEAAVGITPHAPTEDLLNKYKSEREK